MGSRLDLIRCASSETNKLYKISDKEWLYKSKKDFRNLKRLYKFKKTLEKTLEISKDFTNFKKTLEKTL